MGWVEKLLFFGGDGEVFFISSTPFCREEWFLLGGAAGDVYVDKHTADVMI